MKRGPILSLLLCSLALGQWQLPLNQKPMLGVPLDWSLMNSRSLVGYWLMNERSGSRINELCGNVYPGSITGAVWVAGRGGPCLDLGGAAYVRINDSTMWDSNADGKITWNVWVKPTALTGAILLIGHLAGAINGTTGYYLGFSGTTFQLIDNDGNATAETLTCTTVATVGVWQMWTTVIDKDVDTVAFYRDGKYVNTRTITRTGTWAKREPLYFGALTGSAFFYNGQLDVPSIYSRGLSDSEIGQLYRNPFSMFQQDSVALWQAALTDESGPTLTQKWWFNRRRQ